MGNLPIFWYLLQFLQRLTQIGLSLLCLVIPRRYFMLFVAIMKGDVSLVSFSASLSFVYRRATDFSELILYPPTLLKVFISCKSSLVEFWGSLM